MGQPDVGKGTLLEGVAWSVAPAPWRYGASIIKQLRKAIDSMTSNDDQKATYLLARILYHYYCKEKGFTPYAPPWAPRWAIDYAEIAVKWYGYTDEAVDELQQELNDLDVPSEVA